MYLTFADAVKFLCEGVEERGEDYVNTMQRNAEGLESCVYRVPATGEPSCGVGLVLHKGGFDLSTLTDHENGKRFNMLYENLMGAGLLYMHPKTHRLLREFQSVQDSQDTWGTALRIALGVSIAPDPETDVMPDAV
jgi:hypothetical protein